MGFVAWFLMRYLIVGIFAVNQNERAVKTSFGRAQREKRGSGPEDSGKGGEFPIAIECLRGCGLP